MHRFALLMVLLTPSARASVSVYTRAPDEPRASRLDPALGDGHTDATAGLQQAIDKVQSTWHRGVILIPEGRYRLTGTVYVWSGIRLLGYGAHRPTFVLGANTPGFEQPEQSHYLFYFAHEKPKAGPVQDGTSDTFYSGMSNVDFEVEAGNPSAVGIRFHVAQHGILSHLDMHMGSGRAALQDVGNLASNLHIDGGEYAIVTGKTAPGWQFVLMDSVLVGQRKAAIRTQEAGMTLVRVDVRNTPVGIQIPEGEVEQLYLRDSSFHNIAIAAIQPGDDRNVRSQISGDNLICSNVRRAVAVSVAAAELAPRMKQYVIDRLRLGLHIGSDGRPGSIELEHREHAGTQSLPASDIPALPPVQQWVNVRSLGVLGDGLHDDTEALIHAIASHAVLYFPAGRYRLTGTLHLRPQTVLIGLHPFTTQLVLADHTPQFASSGEMIPLIEAPAGGTNVFTGIGISTGAFNPRAAGILWRAGSASMIEDVKFIGGAGTLDDKGQPLRIYPAPSGPSPQRPAAWNTQYPSLIVRDGGGGILRSIWSASTFAKAGLLIENTDTRARVYQFSCEHHMRNEVQMRAAANWQMFALQTEEEKLEGAHAVALDVAASHDILLANLFMYRVSRSLAPARYAATLDAESRVEFANVHVMSSARYAFDNSVFDATHRIAVRQRDLTSLVFMDGFTAPIPLPVPSVFVGGAQPTLLATGFEDITGLTPVSPTDVLFTDASAHRLIRWSSATHAAQPIQLPASVTPLVLADAGPGNLLLMDSAGLLFHLDPATAAATPVAPSTRRSAALLFPAGGHSDLHALRFAFQTDSGYSSGGAFLPELKDNRPLMNTSQFTLLQAGVPQVIATEDDARIYRIVPPASGSPEVTTLLEARATAFVEDEAGNLYIVGDQLSIYAPSGKLLGAIEFPDRPTTLAFTGKDRRTLLVGARSQLFSLRTLSPGRNR